MWIYEQNTEILMLHVKTYLNNNYLYFLSQIIILFSSSGLSCFSQAVYRYNYQT